jgi:hypothetical protein
LNRIIHPRVSCQGRREINITKPSRKYSDPTNVILLPLDVTPSNVELVNDSDESSEEINVPELLHHLEHLCEELGGDNLDMSPTVTPTFLGKF